MIKWPLQTISELRISSYGTKGIPTLINSSLCGPAPTDPRTGTGPRTGGWGPLLYGLPKLHKENIPRRPILASQDNFNYLATVRLNNILTALQEHFSFLKESFSFVKLILTIPQWNQKILVSFDLKSLFTDIPVNSTINLIINQLFPNSSFRDHNMNKQQFCKLLNWSCNHSTFQFKGNFTNNLMVWQCNLLWHQP